MAKSNTMTYWLTTRDQFYITLNDMTSQQENVLLITSKMSIFLAVE